MFKKITIIIILLKHSQPYILLIKIFKKENLFEFKGNMESSHK